MHPKQIALRIIEQTSYLTLATCDQTNPWTAPVFYACDERYNFYFVSNKNSVHAQNIRQNPNISFAIFDSTCEPAEVNGVQIQGIASIVGLKDLPLAIKTMYAKKGAEILKSRFVNYLDPASYLKLTRFRIFKVSLKKCFILDPAIDNDDIRLEVDLYD